MARFSLGMMLLCTVACSQRSPWVTVHAPARATAASARKPEHDGSSMPVALASIARADARLANLGALHFPVAGFEDRAIDDSYEDPRDGGARRHHAIDIMAPRGTPVLSVQDGRILRLSRNSKGGITIYATDAGGRFVFYYAHLDRYRTGLYEGQLVARGDTIGYVGTSGNAPDDVPHLHFQLMRMPADGKYWNGEPINPYALLRPLSHDVSSP